MSKSGTKQIEWYYRTATTNKCLGLTTWAFFLWRISMFKKVHAEPNGDVTFEYGSFTVTLDKDGTSLIRSTMFNEGKYGDLDNIRDSSTERSPNQLYKYI